MKKKMIDLNEFKSPESRVYSGQDRGQTVRRKLNIRKIEEEYETIEIKIPTNTISVNTSFFLGFLGESVRQLGARNFKIKYVFVCSDIIMNDIEIGIERALKISSVFS
jgi:hypothetical protein